MINIYDEGLIQELDRELWDKLKMVEKGDYLELNRINYLIQESNNLKDLLNQCNEKYLLIKNDIKTKTNSEIDIEVTQGALNQGYLLITKPLNQGICPKNGKIRIRTPYNEFEAEIDLENRRIRQRGLISRFYKEADLMVGDKILWREIEKGILYELDPINFRYLSQSNK